MLICLHQISPDIGFTVLRATSQLVNAKLHTVADASSDGPAPTSRCPPQSRNPSTEPSACTRIPPRDLTGSGGATSQAQCRPHAYRGDTVVAAVPPRFTSCHHQPGTPRRQLNPPA
ncbi:hypothetical protein [Streptomyces sp. 1222.5]|uniref:hypothetical protein n=1 Tax=Streptomyces sp. 1222.5 TaxID=1881026 RepID=UPI003D75F3AA